MKSNRLPFALPVLALLLAACGGSPKPASSAGGAPPPIDAPPAAHRETKPAPTAETKVADTPTGPASELHEISPKLYKKLFENQLVRVFDANYKPGDKMVAHASPEHVAYVVAGGTLRVIKNGTPQEVVLKTGEAMLMPAETHALENGGSDALRFIVFELRGGELLPTPKGADLAAVAGAKAVRTVLDNERVRVRELSMAKGVKIPQHVHMDQAVFVAQGGKLRYLDASKPKAEGTRELELSTGYGGFLPAEVVAVQNVGTTDVKLVLTELKPPASAAVEPIKKK